MNEAVETKHQLRSEKGEFLNQLDFEITQITAARQQDGWNKWALYGVAAACLWSVLDQLDKPNVGPHPILLLVLVFTIGADIIRQLKRFLPPSSRPFSRKRRFRRLGDVSSHKSGALHLLRQLATLGLVVVFAGDVRWYESLGPLIYYAYFSFTALIALPAMYFPNFEGVFPNNQRAGRLGYYLHWSILIALLLVGFVAFLNLALSISPLADSIANYRIAALLVVLAYISFLLIEQDHKLPLLSFLIDTRRELVFGRIELETAMREAEIAVMGADIDERLQEDLIGLLSLFEKREKVLRSIEDRLQEFSKEIAEIGSQLTKTEIAAKAREMTSPLLRELETVGRLDEEVALARKLRVHIYQVGDDMLESVVAAKAVLKRIEDVNTEFARKGESLIKPTSTELKSEAKFRLERREIDGSKTD